MIRIPHLETNVTVACENRCAGCNHFVPMQVNRFKHSMILPSVLHRDLRNFGRIAHAEAWAAIGGEPTLHPELPLLLQIAKQSGVADRIEVWTHGMNLRTMPDDFWTAFDTLVVSVYPGKLSDDDIIWIGAACGEAGVALEIKDERRYPNFTRLLMPPSSPEATARRYADCWFKTYSRVLDNGFFYRCCTSPFIAPLLLGLPWGADGLWIDEHTTEEELRRFLDQREPAAGCTVCAGRNTVDAVPLPWREVRDPRAWIEASGGAA